MGNIRVHQQIEATLNPTPLPGLRISDPQEIKTYHQLLLAVWKTAVRKTKCASRTVTPLE
ncbi:MAG: hypothetical protein M3512_14870 [Bacteroidota bacterium]|nr:hypothetical protein [Bacteroidota bacterium]